MQRRRLLASAVAAGLGGLAGWTAAQPAERVVAIVARKFVFLPNEIQLQRGQPVVFEFSAPEVVMGFHAPELKLRTLIVPGQPARLRWVPEAPGSFRFVCDVFCGDGHEGMSGQIIVT